MSNKKTLAAISLVAALLSSQAVLSYDKIEIELPDLDCRALLKMNGEDEQSTVIFMHSYASGKAGATSISIPALTEATDKIKDHCISNPADKLLDVFPMIK